jgi:hypothetical protein
VVGSIFAPPVLTCDEQYDYKGGLVGGVSVGTLPSAKGDEMSRRPARSYACQLTGCDRPLLPGLDRARRTTTRRDDYRHGCSRGSAPTFRAPFLSGSPRPPRCPTIQDPVWARRGATYEAISPSMATTSTDEQQHL